MPTVTVSLIYSPTISSTLKPADSLEVTVHMIVAQNSEEEAINVGYHSNVTTNTLISKTTKIISLTFESLPPTGRYLAQLVAYNDTMLITKLVTLVVANEPPMTPQHRLSAVTDDKRIVIAGRSRFWQPYCWNEVEFLLWEKYVRSNEYYLIASELADSMNGLTSRLEPVLKLCKVYPCEFV